MIYRAAGVYPINDSLQCSRKSSKQIGEIFMSTVPVSVLLPVYNASAYLREALESLFAQTFSDFEIIAINDGSTDGSGEILREAAARDRRMRVVERENRGLVATLNEAAGMARGNYLARMDADDVCLPERLARQVAVLDARPKLAALGTWVQAFGGSTETWKYPESAEATLCAMIFRCPLAHPTVMMRRSLFSEEGFAYEKAAKHAEDFALWLRVTAKHELANVPEVLLRYRVHAEQVSAVHIAEQRQVVTRLQMRFLRERLGIEATEQEAAIHGALAFSRLEGTDQFVTQADDWLLKIASANERHAAFPREAFLRTLVGRWVSVHREAARRGLKKGDTPAIFAPFVHPGVL
jgi:Glycosyl transferase family 2